MKRKLYFISIVSICFLCSGCIGRLIGKHFPEPIRLNDTSTPQVRANEPSPTVKVNMFNDMRDNKEYVGSIYNNMGERAKDVILYGSGSLDKSITIVITEALGRSGYNLLFDNYDINAKANYIMSGNIWSFDIVQETGKRITPQKSIPDSKYTYNPVPNYSNHCKGIASIELNVQDVSTGEIYIKNIEVMKDVDEITAQSMATLVVADIVNKVNSIVYEIDNSKNKH